MLASLMQHQLINNKIICLSEHCINIRIRMLKQCLQMHIDHMLRRYSKCCSNPMLKCCHNDLPIRFQLHLLFNIGPTLSWRLWRKVGNLSTTFRLLIRKYVKITCWSEPFNNIGILMLLQFLQDNFNYMLRRYLKCCSNLMLKCCNNDLPIRF